MVKSYYPINLDIDGKKCVVVGGGRVAERKVVALLRFGAAVVVVSSSFTAKLRCLARERRIELIRRRYRAGDLSGAILAIAATDDPAANEKISEDAEKGKILVNVVDKPSLCSFIAPSIIKRGPLMVSISTSGQAPALSKALRVKLEELISPRMGKLVEELGKRRRKLGTASFRT
ncbi:bifunctional precorrin-2 dehydrogenase/sirohydrochlorin ferrochelatase [Candidatus Saganbacteria bacterium]|uniref:precorrin-2 dehydrogenase n=1 Tax=Candidatus Saganbacteria bacterium TaxID=2575572 RepID=A0A9D6YXY8_UNCSA|nr:bifunctional precorrin-2 dehydrogenase/sirohydrochlorin ferrochelatase [Candidatus Saganbacteria bacterium]